MDDSIVDYGERGAQFGWNELLEASDAAPQEITSRRLPGYLRIGDKNNALERDMKMKLLNCPVSSMRKPTAIMEQELVQIRHALSKEKRDKLREARRLRRLQRKCRVRQSEDLDELEQRYLGSSEDEAPVDPAAREHRPRPTARDYFGQLRDRQPQIFSAR